MKWAIAFVIVCIVASITISVVEAFDIDYYDVTVTDKDIKRNSESTDIYLIYTDNTTYVITDSFIHWRFDSSDLYGSIREGQRYRIKTCGWRIPFLSSYENILEVELLTE